MAVTLGNAYNLAEITHRIMNDTFRIGVYPGLTEQMLDYVAGEIETYFGANF